jgi:hypothetical protein
VIKLQSRILGGPVYVVETEADIPEGFTEPVYTRAELELMQGLGPEAIRTIHESKTEWGGRYVESEPVTPDLFAVPVSFPGGWGDEVRTPKGAGTVVAVWDNEYTASHVTVELDAGGKVTLHASEVSPCATAA